MTIIKKGDPKWVAETERTTCKLCGTEFTYSMSETDISEVGLGLIPYVKCPWCKHRIALNRSIVS